MTPIRQTDLVPVDVTAVVAYLERAVAHDPTAAGRQVTGARAGQGQLTQVTGVVQADGMITNSLARLNGYIIF